MDIKSFAKINVSLQVKGRREDGYHELDMVNLPLELHDVISIDKLSGGDTYIVCDDLRLMGLRTNLCQKAVEAMRNRFGFKENFMIHIHKEIPFAAGLGGGSSNAATVMLAINKMLKLQASADDLKEVAGKIGSDIPYFLRLAPARVGGIGEIVNPIEVRKNYFCLLIKPSKGLSTKDVYAVCDNFHKKDINNDLVVKALQEGDDEALANCIGNDLQPASASLLPEIERLIAMMKGDGFKICQMTGSGSTVFALSSELKKCKEAHKKYLKLGYNAILTKTLSGIDCQRRKI